MSQSPSPKRQKPEEDEKSNEFLMTVREISLLQDKVDILSDKHNEVVAKLELKLELEKQQLFDEREKIIARVPNFWLTVITNHPQLYALLAGEHEIFDYFHRIEVKVDKEDCESFQIIFYFEENPFFTNSFLKKDYKTKSKSAVVTSVHWKEGKDMSQDIKKRESLFHWLISENYGNTDLEIAEMLWHDVYENPLFYYLLGDSDDDVESEEINESDDVILLDDSDDDVTVEDDDELENEPDDLNGETTPEPNQSQK